MTAAVICQMAELDLRRSEASNFKRLTPDLAHWQSYHCNSDIKYRSCHFSTKPAGVNEAVSSHFWWLINVNKLFTINLKFTVILIETDAAGVCMITWYNLSRYMTVLRCDTFLRIKTLFSKTLSVAFSRKFFKNFHFKFQQLWGRWVNINGKRRSHFRSTARSVTSSSDQH